MKIIIFGLGRQGKRIMEFLIQNKFDDISVYEKNENIVKQIIEKYPNIKSIGTNPFNYNQDELTEFLKRYDIIIDALPSTFSFKLLKAISKTGKMAVSVSYLEEDFMELDEIAKSYKTIIIPDCGAAPGMSHLLAGFSAKTMEKPENVIMKVGAIPKSPTPPFMHNITWSPSDLIQEYVRKAKIKRQGEIIYINPFEEIYNERIFNLNLESFYTDGVRSFLTNYPEIKNIEERTYRYKGHLDFMRNLKSLGFLSGKKIKIDNVIIDIDNILSILFEQNFGKLPIEDIYIMEIIVKNNKITHKHKYFIEYDYTNKVSALVNSVAITAANAVILLSKGDITNYGVLPLEKLVTKTIYESFIKAHKEIGAIYEFIQEN